MTGQINLDCEFGRMISMVAADTRYSTFCEVGTWNGMGSTRCFYDGLSKRGGGMLYSIEGDPEMFKGAQRVWNQNPRVTLLYGTLHRDILSQGEIMAHPHFSKINDHYRLWYPTELRTTKEAPVVSVPPCDVILLDGGEFSTRGDWKTLNHSELRVVFLDDTQVIKTHDIYEALKQSVEWTCPAENQNERNGWAMFVRNT